MQGYIARICTSFIDVPGKTAIAIYFAGCSIRCKDCQNPELWDKKNEQLTDLKNITDKIITHPLAESVVFLGGEPTDQMEFLKKLCEKTKQLCNKEIVLYSGREFEDLPKSLLLNLDLIICGPYKSNLHVGGWPASSNQKIFKKKDGLWVR